jgi:signal transduction histidine kinase
MLALVNDLLDVSVIESGRLELRREPCSLSGLLEQRVDFFQLVAEKKRIRIEREIPPGVVVEIDPGRVEQVADNLISNAVKYSPPGSRIDVSLVTGEDEVRLEVRDQGPGLSEDDRARIFGAFQRLSARPTGGEKSTGLGLAITKRIVAAHGGTIDVEAAQEQGSTFVVVLPKTWRRRAR